jgi:hypothetical protein
LAKSELLTAERNDAEAREAGWDGKYENAPCSTAKECSNMADKIFRSSKGIGERVKTIPFHAKACILGRGIDCLAVGQYEEERNDNKAAYKWFKTACDNHPEATGLCFDAIESKLKTNEIDIATALFLKVCNMDQNGYCESQTPKTCGSDNCKETKKFNQAYKVMLKKACDDGSKVACNLKRKF